jgi:hypothetical protein
MEHHEPPRIGPVEGPSTSLGASEPPRATRRAARRADDEPAAPAPRRLALDKLGKVIVLSLAALGLAFAGGSSVSRSVVAWLHRRPEYRVRFDDIVLEPEPPPWIKGGRRTLLDAIRGDRPHLEAFSALDLDLDRLLTDVRRNPWVARADRATKSYPGTIRVALAYREPVALVAAGAGPAVAIDREAVALPMDQLDVARAGPLVKIVAEPPPTAPTPGLAWPGEEGGRRDRAGPRARMDRAARLAGWLKDRLREPGSGRWSPASVEFWIYESRNAGFWVRFDETLVLWGLFPDLDAPGAPTDEEKWRRLLAIARAEGGLKPLGDGEYRDGRSGMAVRAR